MPVSRLVVVIWLLTSASAAQSAASSSPSADSSRTADTQELIAATRSRASAFASGDCEKFASYVAPDFMEIEGFGFTSHEALVKQCQQPHPIPGYRREVERSDFTFKFLGNVAVVTYRGRTIEHFGDFTATESFRGVDTWEKRDGKWLAVWFVFVPVFEDPPPAKIDPATLEDFTGQYGWVAASGMVDTVTRKGDKLYLQTTGDDAPVALIRESMDSFAFHASPDRITFVRDKDGRVVEEYPHSPDGQGSHNKKIK